MSYTTLCIKESDLKRFREHELEYCRKMGRKVSHVEFFCFLLDEYEKRVNDGEI